MYIYIEKKKKKYPTAWSIVDPAESVDLRTVKHDTLSPMARAVFQSTALRRSECI